MSYFDIGDIVADEERLPCTFQIDAELIGYLDSTNDDEVRHPCCSFVPDGSPSLGTHFV
jgi:hypothetical protein